MRNIFDQYNQPENRITHALLSALNYDRELLGAFLRDLVKVRSPVHPRELLVLEQRYPGEAEPNDEQELERRGIPDGWIYAEDTAWCVFIESKVLMNLRDEQIERHRRTAERRGFRTITAVSITPYQAKAAYEDGIVRLEWRLVYQWLRAYRTERVWASAAANYLEIAEAKLIDTAQFVEGTLTMFTGFPFGPDHPYTYLEGKRLLGLALNELRGQRNLQMQLGMNPDVPGRPAITGRQSDAVWNFLSLSEAADAENFTRYPHLTLGVSSQVVDAMVTVPNSVNSTMRSNIKELGEAGFQALLAQVLQNLKPILKQQSGARPWFRGVQRRYPSQKALPLIDARIEFDLRTAVPNRDGPKTQSRWLSAGYGAFVNKAGSNYQIQVGVVFPYEKCPDIRTTDALRIIAEAWLACKPLVALSH